MRQYNCYYIISKPDERWRANYNTLQVLVDIANFYLHERRNNLTRRHFIQIYLRFNLTGLQQLEFLKSYTKPNFFSSKSTVI